MGPPYSSAFTPRLRGAFDQLMGVDKYEESSLALGWWVVTFPGFWDDRLEDDALLEWGAAGHWHVDGAHFQHFINSKEVGLLPIFLFNTIGKHDGGTLLCPGSHRVVAEILHECNTHDQESGGRSGARSGGRSGEYGDSDASEEEEHGGGMSGGQISAEALLRCDVVNNVVEVNGEPGDVVLCHPFMLHARSMNCGTGLERSVRPMCHPGIALKEPMSIYGSTMGMTDSPTCATTSGSSGTMELSPVERAIVEAVQ